MTFKIYTKTGDQGETSLIGGSRVLKSHIRIESYGTTDELNSYLGLIKDQLKNEEREAFIYEIQDRLFTIGSVLASDPEKSKMKIPDLHEEDITFLENQMDEMTATLPELRNFILPGGHTIVSYCHLARVVCRRAERITVHLSEVSYVDEMGIRYLNRLSDYLFTLSRKIASDLGVEEYKWIPRVDK